MMSNTIRAAAVQMDVKLGDNAGNLACVLAKLEEAAANGAKLVVFPECALSGYCFESLKEARRHAEEWDRIAAGMTHICEYNEITAIAGILEKDRGITYNTAVITSAGDWDNYRKTHLPTLGVDRFVTQGNALKVFDAPFGKLGVLICYDIRFPEAARCLALQGADLIALPTNWPEGAESSPDFITRARAWENRVFLVAANRVGVERGRRFIGRSQIVAPSGQILCEAGPEEETILYADLDLAQARQKRIVLEPGAWELDPIGDRRPELYGALGQ
jgi:predicted amidohydrolase